MDYKLRKWNQDAPQDLKDLVHHANNINIARFLSDHFEHPYTMENGKSYLKMLSESKEGMFFCIEINGQAAGSIGIHPLKDIFKPSVELGYWLSEEYWGKGIMTKALGEVVSIAFENPVVTRVFARCFGSNIPSQKVCEKLGFTIEGQFEKTILKNGQYEDELIFAMRKKNWKNATS